MERVPEYLPANYVIAVSSISGGGKSTLVRKTAELLNGSTLLFDEYRASSHYPQDTGQWLADGADFNEWETPDFARDVAALKIGKSVTAPRENRVVHPAEFIVIEEPMGRVRAEMAPHIDFVAFINTPLEIGLARRLARDVDYLELKDLENATHEELTQDYKRLFIHVSGYLQYYLDIGRDLYRAIHEQAIATCDLVLDGQLPVDELAAQLVTTVRERLSA
jgi:uridine kinase